MKLNIGQLSRLTKLSVQTLRVYVSRQKLGKKVGNKRVFSQTDVQKLLESSKKSPAKKRSLANPKRAETTKKAIKSASGKANISKPKVSNSTRSKVVMKTAKPSLWTRLFGDRKQNQKVSLLDARLSK